MRTFALWMAWTVACMVPYKISKMLFDTFPERLACAAGLAMVGSLVAVFTYDWWTKRPTLAPHPGEG